MILFVKGASQLEKNIRNDRHREGAILIRDHVIDHYLDEPRPNREDLVDFLIKKLPVTPARSENAAQEYANDDRPHGWHVATKSDIRRGVKKAYRKLEDGSVKTV